MILHLAGGGAGEVCDLRLHRWRDVEHHADRARQRFGQPAADACDTRLVQGQAHTRGDALRGERGPLVSSLLTVIVAAVIRAGCLSPQTTFRCLLQILRYESMVASKQAQIDPSEILSLMPPSMRDDVTKELYHDFLSRVPLFRGLSSEVCHQQPATLLHSEPTPQAPLRATYAAAF